MILKVLMTRGKSQFKILVLKRFRFAFEEYSKFQEAEGYTSHLLDTLYDITDEKKTSDHTRGVLTGYVDNSSKQSFI